MRFVLHTFRPTETIDGVIRLLGRHAYTKDEMRHLRRAFDKLNGLIVPKPGMVYKIPLPFETTDEFGNVVDTTPAEDDQDVGAASPGVAGSPEPTKVVDSVSGPIGVTAPPPAP